MVYLKKEVRKTNYRVFSSKNVTQGMSKLKKSIIVETVTSDVPTTGNGSRMEDAIARLQKYEASQKRWRDNNVDKVKSYQKKWRESNDDKVKAAHKRYQERNPEKVKEWHKRSQERNRAMLREAKELLKAQRSENVS